MFSWGGGQEDQFQLRTTALRSKGPGSKGITKEVSMCEVGQQGDGGEGQGLGNAVLAYWPPGKRKCKISTLLCYLLEEGVG